MAKLPYTFSPDPRPLTPQEQAERERLVKILETIETTIGQFATQIEQVTERITHANLLTPVN